MKNKRKLTVVEASKLFTDDDKWQFSCFMDTNFYFELNKYGKTYLFGFSLENELEAIWNNIEFSALLELTDGFKFFEILEVEKDDEDE